MKRVFLLITALLILISSSSWSRGQEEATKPLTLNLMTHWGAQDLPILEKLFSIYEKKTGVKVVPISAGEKDFRTALSLTLNAQRTPCDVYFITWMGLNNELAQQGHLIPVGDLIDIDKFPKSFLDVVTVNGNIYSVPLNIGIKPGFGYKKSFFEKNGLRPPTTYDEFLELVAKLDKIPGIEAAIGSGNDWTLTDVTEGFILGFGGVEMFKGIIDGKKNFTDPDVRQVMESVRDLLEKGYFTEPGEWRAMLGKLWDEEIGIFWSHLLMRHPGFEKNPEEIGYFVFPGTNAVTAAFRFVSVPKYVEPARMEAAKDLVKWLGTKEAQIEFISLRQELVPRLDIPLEAYPSSLPHLRWQAQLLKDFELLPDLDDVIGGEFAETFRDQLSLLWVKPGELDTIIDSIASKAPAVK